jgi:vacuolar-type H+-ATPase subunit E/Vma4
MSLEHLLSALREDARVQAAALVEGAGREAQRLLDEAEAARARLRSERLDALARETGIASRSREAEARGACLGRVLEARQRMLDRVLAAAARRLREVSLGERYAVVLPFLLRGALSFAGDGPSVVRCAEELRSRVGQAVRGRAHVSVRPDPRVTAGVVVEALDGSFAVDATLEGRLERLRPLLQIEIVRKLEEAP